MADRVWVRHPTTEAVKRVAESAVPVLEVSGWQKLNKRDAAEQDKRVVDERAARAATAAPDSTDEASAGGASNATADRRSESEKKENG